MSASCGFHLDLRRCNLTKEGSENRVSHDLQQHLNRIRDLTGRKESSSVISSSGRIIGPDAELGGHFSGFADKRFMTAELCII